MLGEYEHLHVSCEDQQRLVLLELAHGKANEMGSAQVAELATLAQRLPASPARALISFSRRRTRSGRPVLSAGADVTERRGWDQERVLGHVQLQRRTMARLSRTPVFHVCVVDGLALGWGAELSLAADYVLAGPEARFAFPETGIGILPAAGGAAHLAQRVGQAQALRLGMTGETIDAAEALHIGLVQERFTQSEDAMRRARELARLVCSRSPTAVAAYKAAVQGGSGQPPAHREELEARAYAHCVRSGEAELGRRCFGMARRGEEIPWEARKPLEP